MAFSPEVAWWAVPSVGEARVVATAGDGWVEVALPAERGEGVTSWALSFWRVNGKLNVASEAPVRVGDAVVSVMSPPAPAATRTEIERLAVPPPPEPVTRRLLPPSAASPGTETSRRTVAGLPGPAVAPSTTKPPPWSVAVQPVGAPLTARAMSA